MVLIGCMVMMTKTTISRRWKDGIVLVVQVKQLDQVGVGASAILWVGDDDRSLIVGESSVESCMHSVVALIVEVRSSLSPLSSIS